MSNYYNLDGIKTELKKEISRNETILEAWENVTFPTKKDGTLFANMSKNFNGAKYQVYEFSMQPGEYELKVYEWDKLNGYIYDTISCYELVKHLKDENKIEKTQNYMEEQPYLEQVYRYDMEDIKKAVNDHIEYLKARIKSLNNQLFIVDSCYNEFKQAYGKALENLRLNCIVAGTRGFSGNVNDIYYMIQDTVKERYPHC